MQLPILLQLRLVFQIGETMTMEMRRRDLLGALIAAPLTRAALLSAGAGSLVPLLLSEAEAANTALTSLSTGNLNDFYYGTQNSVSKKFNSIGIVNVKDFGATGDGTTNDAAAIQAAVNWNSLVATASTAVGTKVLHFADVPANFFARMGNVIAVYNETNPASIVSAIVASFTSTSVTLDVNVIEQVDIGDRIFFGREKGEIHFPPGKYFVNTTSINLEAGGSSQNWIISGDGALITGTVNGYVLDFNGQGVSHAQRVIRDLKITNLHTTAGGAIRLGGAINFLIENCDVTGFVGINTLGAGGASQTSRIVNCNFTRSGNSTDTCGINAASDKLTIDTCDFNNAWGRGIAAYGTQCNIINCRFEVNTIAIALGTDFVGGAQSLLGFTIIGCGWESNLTGIDCINAGQGAVISGQLQGFEGAGPGAANPAYGVRIRAGGGLTKTAFIGLNVGGQMATASWSVGDASSNPANIQFITCTASNASTVGGVTWSLPAKAITAEFINCLDADTNTYIDPQYTFANRPVNPNIGKTCNFSDSTTATWGATITGTGSNKVLGRWNGTNWTVVGI